MIRFSVDDVIILNCQFGGLVGEVVQGRLYRPLYHRKDQVALVRRPSKTRQTIKKPLLDCREPA